MNYEKLQGTGTDGNFVLEGQTLATKQAFGHVSKKWYDQTMSYDEGLEKLAIGRQHTSDITATLSRFTPSVDEDGNFVMVHGDRKFLFGETSCPLSSFFQGRRVPRQRGGIAASLSHR